MDRRDIARVAPAVGAFLLVALLVVAFLLVLVLPWRTKLTVWDDAFMFARYADNLRESGTLAWNPHGSATYGLTSILYLLLVVAPMRLLLPGDPLPMLAASSILCGAAFLLLALCLAWRATDGVSAVSRWNVLLLVMVSLLLQGDKLAFHATSGMDTSFAMAYGAAYLLLALRSEKSESVPLAVVLGVFGGLAIAARPDLMLLSLSVSGVALVTRDRARSKRALLSLALTVAICILWLGASDLYFGSALPLSFYAKATTLYRDFNVGKYASVPAEQWKAFALPNGILLALGTLPILFSPRAWLRDAPSTVKGALLGGGLFTAYYLVCVLQIMPAYARFYYPALPAIVLVGAYGAAQLLRRMREVPFVFSFALAAAVIPRADDVFAPPLPILRQELLFSYRIGYAHVLFALDRFSLLPDDLVIASTEVGHLGVMNPRKTVIDLAGLNDTEFALHGFSATRLFARAPDVLYMPHPDYGGMIRDILVDPALRERYELHSAKDLGALALAIRVDSPHYEAMRRILDEGRKE
jgi:hypothetical protein